MPVLPAPPTPEVAVVVPLVNDLPAVDRCLEALAVARRGVRCEVVVVDRCGGSRRESIRRRHPWVRLVEADAGVSIPELRAIGVAASRADIVAIIEDHCIVGRGWLAAARDAHRRHAASGCGAVGGPIENGAVNRVVDWAAFLCEYSDAMPPLEDGEVDSLPGNNVAYRRAVLEAIGEASYGRRWEYFWHQEIRRRGYRMYRTAEMQVSHDRPFGVAEYLSQRFHYSRSFAAMRAVGAGPLRRCGYALGTVVLPAVLLRRIVTQAATRQGRRVLASLPLLGVFTVSWAAGEFVGYLCGAGGSLERVR